MRAAKTRPPKTPAAFRTFNPRSAHRRAQCARRRLSAFFDLAVAALDVAAGIIHQRLAFGAEPRQDQRRARTQIRCANRRAGQIRRALHDGDAVFHPNVRAQPGKLGGVHEAVFKIVSRNTLVPGVLQATAIIGACKSVGKPG